MLKYVFMILTNHYSNNNKINQKLHAISNSIQDIKKDVIK